MNMEKVKMDVTRAIVIVNLIILIRAPLEAFGGASLAEIIDIMKSGIPIMNFGTIIFLLLYNNFIKSGVYYSAEGLIFKKILLIPWDRLTVDLSQNLNSANFITSRKINVMDLQTKKEQLLYVNKMTEKSFVFLTEKYAPKGSPLSKAFETYSSGGSR
jgi:hypothetical protein